MRPNLSAISSNDPRRRARLITRAIVAVGAIIVLATWVSVAASIRVASQSAFDHARAEGRNLAISFENDITHVLGTIDSTMEAIARRMRAAHGPIDLYAWSRENPTLAWTNIQGSIVAPDGTLQSTTLGPAPDPVNFADREHIRIHLDGPTHGLYIGRPVTGRIWKVPFTPVSRRVEAEDGTLLGVVVFLIPPASLTNLYKSINLGDRGLISLAGLDNIVRARFSRSSPEGLDGIGGSVAGGPRPSQVDQNDEGFYVRPSVFDGVTRLFAYRRVANYPLVVTVGLDLDSALAAAHRHAWMIGTIAAAATMLLVLLAAYLIREIRFRALHEIDLAGERGKLEAANAELTSSKEYAEAASRAKSEFLANMSDELRTPLHAIIGFSELIRDEHVGPIGNARYAGYATDILDAGRHLLSVINDVLDLAKIEAGKVALENDIVDLAEIINASVAQVRAAAEDKNLRLDIAIDTTLPRLRADEHKLRQVLINLLANAVKFTPADGHVSIGAARLAAGSVEITVRDDGIGMNGSEIAIALEPFAQIENALTKTHEGTGLGLPLTKRLVMLHGGLFEIDSAKGVGTTARVVLPASRVVDSGAPQAIALAL